MKTIPWIIALVTFLTALVGITNWRSERDSAARARSEAVDLRIALSEAAPNQLRKDIKKIEDLADAEEGRAREYREVPGVDKKLIADAFTRAQAAREIAAILREYLPGGPEKSPPVIR